MPASSKIYFTSNATTREAAVLAARYTCVFFHGVFRAVNAFAHRLPWLCVGLTVVAAVTASFVFISGARAERDAASRRMAQLQQQVDQLTCALEARKEAAR